MFRLAMRYCELSDIYLACVSEARSSGAMGLILPLVPFQMSYDHLVCNGMFLIENWTNVSDKKLYFIRQDTKLKPLLGKDTYIFMYLAIL